MTIMHITEKIIVRTAALKNGDPKINPCVKKPYNQVYRG
jgi:hypothetical protein